MGMQTDPVFIRPLTPSYDILTPHHKITDNFSSLYSPMSTTSVVDAPLPMFSEIAHKSNTLSKDISKISSVHRSSPPSKYAIDKVMHNK